MSIPTPKLRMTRDAAPPSDARAIRRGIILITALTNIIATAITLVIVAAVRWAGRDKIRGWHLLIVGLATSMLGVLLGWPTAYAAPWTEVIDTLRTPPLDLTAVLTLASTTWPTWAVGQVPFAACLGLTAAGIYLAWRDRYRKTWQTTATPTAASSRAITAAKRRLDKTVAHAKPAPTPDQLTLPLGIDATTAGPVTIPASVIRTHALVIGPTGVGKTEALKRLLWATCAQPAARALHIPAVVIDMKADPDLAAWVQAQAAELGRPYHRITVNPATSTSGYNPLAGRTADEIADAVYEVLFAHDTSLNQHYATLSRRLIQVASRTLVDLADNQVLLSPGRPWTVNLPNLARLCSTAELRLIVPDVTPPTAQIISRYLTDLKASSAEKDAGDARDRLITITDTTIGAILGTPGLTLRTAIADGALICFSLDSAGSPESARALGRLAIHDLTATLPHLPVGWAGLCPIVLDEFGALASPKVSDLYARARSAGGAVVLATQDLDSDLTAVSAQFAGTVRTNANLWIVMRQTRGDVAESIAHDIGTRAGWKETIQTTDDWDPLGGLHAASGVGSLRQVDEYIIHPNELRDLPAGTAIIMTKLPADTLHHHHADTTIHRTHIAQAPQATPANPRRTPAANVAPRRTPRSGEDGPAEQTPPPPPPPDDAW
ncbi:type IV secretion system DNA-binding domain-containing protein [Actinobaculum sp. 352]|uniref:type IV secretory system conjugative DNA transfer family protein n=1 Tax=Actinobaculum sp. 352 TaxID=2490946 RepID=UPI000F7E603B|nr:type IV secretion system DNA-binding domain-containing protein [Actinobaculum sp. 352]RTE49074.1 hypothetical protein EKN07_08075 [Actinobaculum sp. 352]